jgi:hypothetical protein
LPNCFSISPTAASSALCFSKSMFAMFLPFIVAYVLNGCHNEVNG